VAVIALPLAMALGIASIPQNVADEMQRVHPWLTPPAMGLFTAVVAGFLISALGGSRVQIGGPTAAFIRSSSAVAAAHGYEGLALATIMAGAIVFLMGVFRFGQFIKFIPYPVTTGFTAGIAVSIFASQIKDFLGLTVLTAEGTARDHPGRVRREARGALGASADHQLARGGSRRRLARDPDRAAALRAARARAIVAVW
jgi:SulP family sulfate permease